MLNQREKIYVYRDYNKHILIRDKKYNRVLSNLFFDIHTGERIVIKNSNREGSLEQVYGREKDVACDVYTSWLENKDKTSLIKRAQEHFPTNESETYQETQLKNYIESRYTRYQSQNTIKFQQDNDRESTIKEIISRQNISRLIHFTHVENLKCILKWGILSRTEVEEKAKQEKMKINDEQRFDKHPEAICLSISFPNYKMFYTFHKGNCDEWVVISIKPEVLWKYECAFCHTNAASNECRHINIGERKKVEALNRLFEDFENIKRGNLAIPDHYPTDPQAEVLVFNKIPIEDFLKVYFYNWNQMNYYKETYPMFENLFEINRNYFRARQDYRHWQNNQNNYATNSDLDDDDEIPF